MKSEFIFSKEKFLANPNQWFNKLDGKKVLKHGSDFYFEDEDCIYVSSDWVEEVKTFTKSDLQVGYLVKLRGVDEPHIVVASKFGWAIVNENGYFLKFSDLSDDMRNIGSASNKYDIMEVYGLANYPSSSLKFEIKNRELLWARK